MTRSAFIGGEDMYTSSEDLHLFRLGERAPTPLTGGGDGSINALQCHREGVVFRYPRKRECSLESDNLSLGARDSRVTIL